MIVKIKQKPKQSFNIASVLKDLRKEKTQTNTDDQKEEEAKEEVFYPHEKRLLQSSGWGYRERAEVPKVL